MTPFALFWHRHGNTLAGARAVRAAAARAPAALAGRPLAHGLELDLKWAGPLLYAWHGPTGRERLSAARARAWARDDRLVLVDALLAEATGMPLLIELKAGHGEPDAALAALGELLRGRAGVWLAASSLELLAVAARALPAVPRVLFGAPLAGGRVRHAPTTSTLRSLLRHGVAPRLAPGAVDLLCPIGLWARTVDEHAALAAEARGLGLRYLPGRVTARETLEGLARDPEVPGAFVYADAAAWGGAA